MASPVDELGEPKGAEIGPGGSNEWNSIAPSKDEVIVDDYSTTFNQNVNNMLRVNTNYLEQAQYHPDPSPSQIREHAMRLDDDLAVLEAERVVSGSQPDENSERRSIHRSRSRKSEAVDDFDVATEPLHETAAVYRPAEHPNTSLGRIFRKIHNSSFLIRYVTYISPVVLILLIPLLLGALVYKNASVGGVQLVWFSIWLEIVWLTLWAGRIAAKCIPMILDIVSSVLTNNSKKWRDLGKQLELPATVFFWWLGIQISFLPTMNYHHVDGNKASRDWELTMNKIIISIFVGTILNLAEKIIIQLIAMSFHLRTYADRIEVNKFQIGSLTKLYAYSRGKISESDEDFEIHDSNGSTSGNKTPLQYARDATKVAKRTFNKVGDVAGMVAGDFTGKKINKSSHPHQVVLTLLHTTSSSQVLARRLYRTFVRDGFETVFSGDLKAAFENNDEAEAAFTMFDKDMNGDISMEELEAVCVEIGRERKSITASLKDLDSVVSRLDSVLFFIVFLITVLIFLSLISASAAGVLTSAGSTILALSWLFSATAQEFLQSVIFVFVKHPFDVGDRVTIYGNTGALLHGDDYFVKEISLLYTEFKKMEGHVVQAPNSYLNTLFILNQRRSGGLAEAVPIVLKFGTPLEQIDSLRQRLLEFVRTEKREYQSNILTELREVTENFSITLNVVFFYKSNWQNEGLRLQRRNKFICMLMISLQEIGIKGPRMNLQGAHVDYPLHVAYSGHPPPSYTATNPHSQSPHCPETIVEESNAIDDKQAISSTTGLRSQHSILRRGSNVATARARGESSLRPVRHVDFSLGMSNVASSDIMGNVFEDSPQERLGSVVRQANESTERRIREEEEAVRAASRDRRDSVTSSTRVGGGLMRSRTSTESRTSAMIHPVHQNRFLSRLGSTRTRNDHTSDVELGRYGSNGHSPINPRSGQISGLAIHDDTYPFLRPAS